MTLINEAELKTRLDSDSDIIGYILRSRPPTLGDTLLFEIEGIEVPVSISDIYFLFSSSGPVSLVLQKDQLATPIGRISDGTRTSAKAIPNFQKINTVNTVFEGGGGSD